MIYHLEHIDSAKNMYRYYQLYLSPSLFNDWIIKKDWGRIGQKNKHPFREGISFPSFKEAQNALQKFIQNKTQHGYKLMDVLQ
ncbi:MAG: WGR domain-containing protein [Zymomonas mobilis]|uniref:Putative DNA-binding WGR domain protein n=1 Tax=Zymomonas mobilis TaxID=542 RepID=A0A542VZR3_ZYMMB|nr:WGR domain-containing protein [Zymomonas mobilis]TQL16826.1 putative DNA-binding WGR domain protein [Zymomonas mobilis]